MAHSSTIQLAERSDAPAIRELQRLAYQIEAELYQDWGIAPLKESLEEMQAEFDRQVFFKAIDGDSQRIVGSVRAKVEQNVCFVGRLIVHPEFQGRGIGQALMHQVENHFPQARRFELFTGYRSIRNLRLYQHLGYTPFREQKISDQLTFVYLQKSLPNPTAD